MDFFVLATRMRATLMRPMACIGTFYCGCAAKTTYNNVVKFTDSECHEDAGVQISIQFQFNSKKFIVSLSTNEYWTLIQVHNHKHDSGLGTTLRDISKLYFFAGWKHVDCAATATKKSTVVTSHGGGGCPTKVFNCLTQNKTFLLY